MNLNQLNTQKQALSEMKERLDRITVACTTCEHYRVGFCKKYQAQPPIEVVKTGCDDWVFDGCPF